MWQWQCGGREDGSAREATRDLVCAYLMHREHRLHLPCCCCPAHTQTTAQASASGLGLARLAPNPNLNNQQARLVHPGVSLS
jgi:hypothetical protein